MVRLRTFPKQQNRRASNAIKVACEMVRIDELNVERRHREVNNIFSTEHNKRIRAIAREIQMREDKIKKLLIGKAE